MNQHVTNTIIVQRQTLDWSSLSHESFRAASKAFCQLWGRPDDYVYNLMMLWDRTFACSYFETRQRIKIISQDALLNLPFTQFVPYQSYSNIPKNGAMYLFVDDDDWLSPNIGAALDSPALTHCDGLLWRSANIGSPAQQEAVFVWGLNGRVMTNNYAVSGTWLQQLEKLDAVLQHAAAFHTFKEMPHIVELDKGLSATNKSPCSSVSLERGLQKEYSPQKLVMLIERYLNKMAMIEPAHLQLIPWTQPLMLKTVDVFKDVLASKKI